MTTIIDKSCYLVCPLLDLDQNPQGYGGEISARIQRSTKSNTRYEEVQFFFLGKTSDNDHIALLFPSTLSSMDSLCFFELCLTSFNS